MLSSLLAVLVATVAQAEPEPVDYVIRGAAVYDGTGSRSIAADVAIRADRIVAVGPLRDLPSRRTIDGRGLVLAPGFIDLHTHSDREITQPRNRANVNYLLQGVTTIVTGNCGGGPTDVQEMFAKIAADGAGSNVIHLIPHGSVRQAIMGDVNRHATTAELVELRRLVERELQHGAWGMSTGLIYTPSCYAPTEELIELSKVVAAYGGIYASHIRGEGSERLLDAIREAIRIGREARLPVHISHLKASGRPAWGMVRDACTLIEQARDSGQTVTADQYPYVASSTSLAAMTVPTADREGGDAAFLKRLNDAEAGPPLRQRIADQLAERGGGSTIRIASYGRRRDWVGKSVAEIAQAQSLAEADVVVEILRHGGAGAVSFGMSEDDVRFVMQRPYVATASDGSARVPDDTRPHPRSYGCFPRKIGRYAIEQNTLPLELAIRSASGLPADILRLPDRGYVKPGYLADVVVFEPSEFRDQATFDSPHHYATGLRYLWVNGQLTIESGRFAGVLAGRPLRRPVRLP